MPYSRRTLIKHLAIALGLLTGSQAIKGTAASDLGAAAGASYAETLAAGLKCRRPEEFAFVRHVARLVETGKLPRSLVDSTFFYARRQPPYPYVYFEYGLRTRAERLGFAL